MKRVKSKPSATSTRALDSSLKTSHRLHLGDARQLEWVDDNSVHLVVTSPPYWTLKQYNENHAQLGAVADYDAFMDELDKVWQHCFRVLVPGGRLVCVVGDVCIARRRNKGRHMVVPLHAGHCSPFSSHRIRLFDPHPLAQNCKCKL